MSTTMKMQSVGDKMWAVSTGVCTHADIIIPVDQLDGLTDMQIGKYARSLVQDAKKLNALGYCEWLDCNGLDDAPDVAIQTALELLEEFIADPAILLTYVRLDTKLEYRKKTAREKERKQHRGYVYVLQAGPYYKIGASKDIGQRIKQLSTLPPFNLTLVHSIKTPDMFGVERNLHDLFRLKRINGEWFELNSGDITWLKGLQDG